MKIVEWWADDDEDFNLEIAQIVGGTEELRSLGHELKRRAQRNYSRIRDSGNYSKLVKLTREKGRGTRNVDYVVSVEDNQKYPGVGSLEFGHWTGSKKTPKHLRRWVQGRFPMTNALPGLRGITNRKRMLPKRTRRLGAKRTTPTLRYLPGQRKRRRR